MKMLEIRGAKWVFAHIAKRWVRYFTLALAIVFVSYVVIQRWPGEIDRSIRSYQTTHSIETGVVPVAEILQKIEASKSEREIICILAPYQSRIKDYPVEGGMVRVDDSVPLDLLRVANEYLERNRVRAGESEWLVVRVSENNVAYSRVRTLRIATTDPKNKLCVLLDVAGFEVMKPDVVTGKPVVRLIRLEISNGVAR